MQSLSKVPCKESSGRAVVGPYAFEVLDEVQILFLGESEKNIGQGSYKKSHIKYVWSLINVKFSHV